MNIKDIKEIWNKIIGFAANQDFYLAQYSLGVMYYDGQVVIQDYREAFKCFHKAAYQGNALAQYALGFMHDNGKGVIQDYQEAVKWYTKAANQDYMPAIEALKNDKFKYFK